MKLCEIVGKIGGKWEKNGINFPFFSVPFPPFFHSLATFPSGVFDKFCWLKPTGKMETKEFI